MLTRRTAGAALLAGLVLTGCEPAADDVALSSSPTPSTTTRTFQSSVELVAETVAPEPTRAPTRVPLLLPAGGGDGDSWEDRAGTSYRLGLVNAPEAGECFGARATARRKALVRSGFRATAYAEDAYGRAVSLVTLPDGRVLNVLLAREGLVDDRYLAEFRHENEALATTLDTAFAEAKRARRGLWGACRGTAAPRTQAPAAPAPQAVAASSCHPDYATCVPVKGDGSGRGEANDLDCPDIGHRVTLRRVGVDPYRLDADGDGTGCDSS